MNRPDPPVLEFDDIRLDLAGQRLLRGGVPQRLDPAAFAVLCLLARSPGQVFSPDEIVEEAWGQRLVPPGMLVRTIALLRHALGDDAAHPRYLHTVHGYGYRFDRPSPRVADAPAPLDAQADDEGGADGPLQRMGAGAEPSAPRAWAARRARMAHDFSR